ncbi:MAG: hypothetical protein LBU47_03670, partial [Christensenellaceae bacterium]|nr:hypothetical protein [Christensenellaceae bacterium]
MARQWYHYNLRFLQTVLREIDIIGYDVAGVVNYMKESNTNCLVVNAGGVMDFFENPLEMANENIFRDGRDLLGEICRAVHAAGMRVLVRVDFRGVEQRRYELHPDWFAVDQDGNPKVVAAGPASVRIMRPCYNSHYTQGHAVAYIQHLLQNYEIDGIWQNALGFDSGPCYCKSCRDLFFKECGEEIPRVPAGMSTLDALDLPAFAKYRAWKAGKADEHIERLRAAVKAFGEEKVYCAEIFDMLNSGFTKMTGIGHDNARKSFDFIVSCVFIDSTNKRPFDIISNAGTTIRFSRSLDERKQPVIVTGGNGTKQRYIAAPMLETRLWLWEIAASGGG